MLHKIAYWTGDDTGQEIDLITEVATTDPQYAVEALHAMAYRIEEGDKDTETTEGLRLKVATLEKMLGYAQHELDIQIQKVADATQALTAMEAKREDPDPDEKADWAATTSDRSADWAAAAEKLQEAFDAVSRTAAKMVHGRAEEVIKAQGVLSAMQTGR